ncbi:UNVERIFIED_CONTAM: hypothetical protein Scaly_2032100 [Sesamum calycinum]|uniref:Copia protein n=1 Tax=Sesamum calycinum TaxID=2727403 RepID=A0AAW2N3S9_9LAMI
MDTPMDSNLNFWNDDRNYLEDKTKYRRLVGKLIYLTVTGPDISFVVGLIMLGRKMIGKSTSGYCTYVGGNLVTWRRKNKLQLLDQVLRLNIELQLIPEQLVFMYDDPAPMHCDNQVAIHIASNPIFHERTKHIEVDCRFVCEAFMS